MSATEISKARMNLAAIKRVDPYAKDIVDTTSHVAFYTFNSEQNEWEKTDVEGAFFIYSRNAQPFHSIFINNRINTTSFVEPITSQLELQSQPPFLLYRNERSRIRGFWFYNSEECDRIGNVVASLVQEIDSQINVAESVEKPQAKEENVNIFKLLSKAQQEYNSSQQKMASGSVLKFFAAAKPRTTEIPFFQRALPNTLSVEQIENQQRAKTPRSESKSVYKFNIPDAAMDHSRNVIPGSSLSAAFYPDGDAVNPLKLFSKIGPPNPLRSAPTNAEEECLRQLLVKESPTSTKPALMPPTMFDKPSMPNGKDPLDQSQLIQAFNYLIHNDGDFVQKLHEAYLKVYKSIHTNK